MTERENKTSLLMVLGDGILLICALAGLTGSFLTLYGSAELGKTSIYSTPLDLCAAQSGTFLSLAVIFALTSLAVWSLPRFRWAAAGGAVLLLGLLAWSCWQNLVQGAALTVHTITIIFSQRVSWGWVFSYDSGLTPAEQGFAARTFLVLALGLLALALGWALVRARRWWVALLLTLPPLIPGLLADLFPDWMPFMALAACWCVMLLTDLCKWAAPSSRGKLTLAMLPCVAAVLAVITFAFPREGYTRPGWALDMSAGLSHGAGSLSDFFSRFDGPFKRTITYVGSAEEADLAHAGPLSYSGRTVLRVNSDYSGRLYLRGTSLAVYEDGIWKALPAGTYQEWLDGLDNPDDAISPLIFPAVLTGHNQDYTITVDNVGAVGTCVYAPYFLADQDWGEAGMLPVEDTYLARLQGGWVHTMTFASLQSYNDSAVRDADYRQYVYDHYLDVPEEYRQDLAQFCMEHDIYGATSYNGMVVVPMVTAHQIAALLDQVCEYDPETPAPPDGVDPVAYFLNDSRRGYCMHFASAATLMLRSLGIPTRYVSGFTVESVPDRQVSVPDRAAHAWVEVWINGFGWYPVEVTPAAAFEWYQTGGLDPDSLPSDLPEESEEPEPSPTPSQDMAPSEEPSAGLGETDEAHGPDFTALIPVLKVLAAIAGTAALLWLGQYLPKKIRAARLNGPDPNRAALDGYGYLLRMERWGGRVDQRAVELAQKARFSQHTLTPEELDELRRLVDWERERLCVVLDPAVRLAFRYCWGMPPGPKFGKNTGDFPENGS